MNLHELVRRTKNWRGKQWNMKSSKYLDFIREQPCVVSGVNGVDAHHVLRKSQSSNDYLCVPLDHALHMELHSTGVETFERKYSICLQACAVSFLIGYTLKEAGKWEDSQM